MFRRWYSGGKQRRKSCGPLIGCFVRSVREGLEVVSGCAVRGEQITFDLPELGQINSCGYQRAKPTAQQEYPHPEPEIHGLSALQALQVTGYCHTSSQPSLGIPTHQEMVKKFNNVLRTIFVAGVLNGQEKAYFVQDLDSDGFR